jgi:hypothetical protein
VKLLLDNGATYEQKDLPEGMFIEINKQPPSQTTEEVSSQSEEKVTEEQPSTSSATN